MRIAASALVSLYLIVSISDIHRQENFYYNRAHGMKYLVKGLEAESSHWSGKSVWLAGVSNDLFWSGFYDDPFRLLGLLHIYLAPGDEKTIEDHPEWGSRERFISTVDQAVAQLRRGNAVVYKLEGKDLRDVTAVYRTDLYARFAAEHGEFVDAGDVAYNNRFGAGWYPIEKGYRWMSRAGAVWMAGPKSAGEALYVAGYCPAGAVAKGAVTMSVKAGERVLGSAVLKDADSRFELRFELPAELVGKPRIDLRVEISRTFRAGGDSRELGLIFGTFSVK
jgi:hypothetical protein